MAEEHRCQAPRLCVNNCGFFGSPATQNLCSKCYCDLQLKEQQSSNAKLVLNQTLASTSASSPSSSSSSSTASASVSPSFPATVDLTEISSNQPSAATPTTVEDKKEVTTPIVRPNRCLTCRKRVGLTGFKCRCDMVFCGTHRYPEQHGCAFDFKAIGKEQIAKANPLIKAEKLEKI